MRMRSLLRTRVQCRCAGMGCGMSAHHPARRGGGSGGGGCSDEAAVAGPQQGSSYERGRRHGRSCGQGRAGHRGGGDGYGGEAAARSSGRTSGRDPGLALCAAGRHEAAVRTLPIERACARAQQRRLQAGSDGAGLAVDAAGRLPGGKARVAGRRQRRRDGRRRGACHGSRRSARRQAARAHVHRALRVDAGARKGRTRRHPSRSSTTFGSAVRSATICAGWPGPPCCDELTPVLRLRCLSCLRIVCRRAHNTMFHHQRFPADTTAPYRRGICVAQAGATEPRRRVASGMWRMTAAPCASPRRRRRCNGRSSTQLRGALAVDMMSAGR